MLPLTKGERDLKLWLWLKKLFHKENLDRLTPEEEKDVAIAEKEIATGQAKSFDSVNDFLDDLHRTRSRTVVPKAGKQATRKDYGKFMKHGHQAPWYRKSVKAKVKPEEEEDNSPSFFA